MCVCGRAQPGLSKAKSSTSIPDAFDQSGASRQTSAEHEQSGSHKSRLSFLPPWLLKRGQKIRTSSMARSCCFSFRLRQQTLAPFTPLSSAALAICNPIGVLTALNYCI